MSSSLSSISELSGAASSTSDSITFANGSVTREDFSDNEIIDCEPLKIYRNNQYPFCFCTLYLPYLCFGGCEGGAYSRLALKIILLGGGVGAYSRLGAY